jgi:hypothetical protein
MEVLDVDFDALSVCTSIAASVQVAIKSAFNLQEIDDDFLDYLKSALNCLNAHYKTLNEQPIKLTEFVSKLSGKYELPQFEKGVLDKQKFQLIGKKFNLVPKNENEVTSNFSFLFLSILINKCLILSDRNYETDP